MPPQRTFLPVAPVKTERTHEENQERAYIAASRRSDRSLEARVESARRASEIHKRRTGRSLRVTEQDVLNEEMYEEEDDDLPFQYRRLTAHLQTGSADFNRRLAAYLTNHVAMRSALDQAITASYAQQFPNAPQFAHNDVDAFPSPFPEPSNAASPTAASPTSPHPYRHAPYPTLGMPGYRPGSHHRAASISTEHDLKDHQGNQATDAKPPKSPGNRRASMPAPKPLPASLKREAEEASALHDIREASASSEIKSPGSQLPHGFSPFTTTLPPDTQQLVGPALDPTDPFTYSLLSGSAAAQFPLYEADPYATTTKTQDSSFMSGMNSTLAPAPVSSQESRSFPEGSSDVGNNSHFQLSFDDLKGEPLPFIERNTGNNALTPGAEGAWDAFIDDSSWAENAS